MADYTLTSWLHTARQPNSRRDNVFANYSISTMKTDKILKQCEDILLPTSYTIGHVALPLTRLNGMPTIERFIFPKYALWHNIHDAEVVISYNKLILNCVFWFSRRQRLSISIINEFILIAMFICFSIMWGKAGNAEAALAYIVHDECESLSPDFATIN